MCNPINKGLDLLNRLSLSIAFIGAICAPASALECGSPIDFGLVSDGLEQGRRGINLELLDEITLRTGCRFNIIPAEIPRIEHDLESGTMAMSARFFETADRSRFAWFAHFQRTKNVAIRAPLTQFDTSEQLKAASEIKIGAVRGFSYGRIIDPIIEEVARSSPDRLTLFRDRRALAQGLKANRVQVIFMPESIFASYEPSTWPIVDLAPNEPAQLGGLILSKQRFSPSDANEWRRIIDELCRDGTILRIFRRYFPATVKDLACSAE